MGIKFHCLLNYYLISQLNASRFNEAASIGYNVPQIAAGLDYGLKPLLSAQKTERRNKVRKPHLPDLPAILLLFLGFY